MRVQQHNQDALLIKCRNCTVTGTGSATSLGSRARRVNRFKLVSSACTQIPQYRMM